MMKPNDNKEKCSVQCHKNIDDCSQCYCDFYDICPEITQGSLGGYRLPNGVWACEKCETIHNKMVVNFIEIARGQGDSDEIILRFIEGIFKKKGEKNDT